MSHKHQLEMALTSGDGKRHVTEMSMSSKMTDSILGSMHSFMSHSHSHSIDFSYHSDSSDGEANHSIATNPKNWHWDQVKVWLTHKGLSSLIPIFQEDHRGHGVDGHKLLELNRDILMNEHPFDLATRSVYHFNQEDINNETETETEKRELNEPEKKELISHLLMELAKLQTKNEGFVQEQALDYTEFQEIRRRIDLFLRKWERILWIEHYEDAFNELPSRQQIADEFGVTPVISTLYIEAYENMNKQKHQDLSELFEGFNIIHDCVIWWKLIIHELKNKPRKSIWIVFEEIALYTPTPVGISLLEHFKFDLTRFPEQAVDAVCKNLVIASKYPINAALEIAKWMLERADYDISRTELFQELSDNYINAALEYLGLIESDHMACIILETKSDLNNMSAFDMALEYKLLSFVKHNRIERISNSIMNEYKFLDPINKNETFKINPLSTDLFWNKLWTREFYFTSLGLYATQFILYIVYLFLFTYLSSQQFRVYDDMTIEETVFWIFNIGYVLYEVFSIIDEGLHVYLSQASNYFDFVISSLFIASFALRIYVWIKKQFLGGLNCELNVNNASNNCADLRSNTIFVILWGINTIALWIRLTFFCVLSTNLGPMIRMVQRMMTDIIVFLEIIGIILIGFIVCLVFVVGDVLSAFASFPVAFLTLFRASQGDFDWDQLEDLEGVNPAFLLFAYLIISVYMIIAAIVLLNLLIAMMAKTFDSINETTISQIIFARFELALELDNESSFMPPPFNVFAMMGMIIFYIIEFIINHTIFCCSKKHHFDLCVLIMPNWLKHKKLELDSQIVGSKCHILTSEGDSIGLITSFDSDVHHHEITFYEDENEIGKKTALKKNVIIGNHINKKNKWNVDIFHLSQEKYLKLDQFSEKLTSDITLHFKQDSLKDRKKHHKSHHWICKYCRMYVKESKISVKRLGRELNVNDRDLKLLTNISPEICPNCYRVRHDTQRWRLIWEIISLYIYYLGVFPILFILFSLLLCISMIRNPHEAVHSFQIFRKHIHHYCKHITCCKSLRNIGNRYDSNTRAALKLMHAEDVHHEDSDSESSSSSDSDDDLNINYETMSVKQIKKIKSRRKDRKKDYVIGHYDSHELIHTLHHIGHGDTDELFDHSISADIWTNLSSSKKSIDLYIMRSRVSEHIISLSTEDEITQLDFYIDFINYEDINFTKWEILFKPFAHSIFSHIHDSREMELPLHLFAKYPMAPRMVLDDFEHWHHACENKDIKINECKSEDIINFLEEYGSLRCRDREEYKYLLHHICESDDYKHDHHTEYDQFVAYLKEVRLLFTETKKLKNLIRDVGIAILERGPDHEIIRQEIDLLFEEIPTSIVALPFFRAMKQETDIIKLWTIRNFLKVIYLLRALVKDTMLDMNPHVYVTKKLLIRLVFEKFKNKIVDKRNIMEQYMSKKKKRKLERIKTKIRFKLDTTSPNSPNIMNPNPNNSSDSDNFSSDEDSDEEEEEWKGHERSLKDDDSNSDENKNNNNEINIKLKQIEIARFKKKRRETGHDHESDHSHDKREEMRLKRKKQLHKNQLRIKLLHTNRVTASTIAKVVGFIFDQIRFGRKKKAKITSSTMEHYQHKLPLGFRNNISLHFIYSQLCRYIIFKPYSLKQECTNTKLTEIITCIKYDSTHIIDIQSQPNYGNIENIYKHIKLIYDLSNIESSDKHPFMTIEDCVCIILLFYRIFDNLSEKINGRSDEFVVTRPVFQKFCDRDNFRPGMDAEKWSKTAKEASNLFQSVLDTEQNYVTLGELRQTIIHLINDVDDMKSGHLIRIKNYLMERVQKDEDRRAKNLPKYKQKLLKWKQIHKNDIDNKSDDDDDDEKSELVSSKKNKKNNDKKAKKKPKNPKLQYAMINVANFSQFISKISEGYVPKIDGHKIVTKHNNNDEKKDDDDDNDEEYASDLFSRIASVAICVVDEKHDKISEDNEIETETETENKLQSDIEKMKKSLANLENDSEIKQEEEVKVEKKVEKKEKHNYFSDVTVDTKKMNRKYKTVYDYMLLKYEHRITLQQLIQYLRSLKRWLESNVYLITMIKNYDLAEDDTENEDLLFKLEEKMKKTKIGSYAQFFAKYFGNQCYKNKNFTKEEYLRHISKRDREIRWIFDQCHKEFDLIYLLTPFIHGKIIKEIDELLDSSDDVEGNYELRSEEFAQLKHQLHVNGHAAVQLFHIMRAHQQALSWKQILSYFIFLNKIKLVIDDCIRRNNKGEDADLSIDKMKLELHITSQDEANWLFQTVEHHHAQKVSWKHFRNYLNKSLMIRQDVKDFFDEQEAQHEYNENAYVLIQKLQQSVDNINNK